MEIELKFQVPPASRPAVARALAGADSKLLRLQAQYFDTADRALARSGLALRVRREGRRWVQTLKGAGDGLFQRVEHEVPVAAPAGIVPTVDPARHDGTPAGAALRSVLGDAALLPTYGTTVSRRTRVLRSGGARIELALDIGWLDGGARRLALHELEFELLGGKLPALFAAAGQWAGRHGLVLDIRSKAERGDRLARGETAGPARKAQPLQLPPGVGADAAVRAIVANCLRQILGNASEIAHDEQRPAHVHQLRVGLRRLRTALRELGALAPDASPDWAEPLEALFRELGVVRDRDALAQGLLPALHAAGAGLVPLPPLPQVQPPQQLLAAGAVTKLWLELLAFAAGGAPATAAARVKPPAATPADAGPPQPPPPPQPYEPSAHADPAGAVPAAAPDDGGDAATDGAFAPAAARRLRRLHRQVRRDAERFELLDDEHRHRLRKRLKRLRYLCEFAASCFDAQAVQAYLKQLTPAQEALGEFNDVCVARALLQPAAATDPAAAYAAGWLAHEHADALRRCGPPLANLREAQPFW